MGKLGAICVLLGPRPHLMLRNSSLPFPQLSRCAVGGKVDFVFGTGLCIAFSNILPYISQVVGHYDDIVVSSENQTLGINTDQCEEYPIQCCK